MARDLNAPVPVPPALELEALSRYLREQVPQLGDNIEYFQFPGGNSNLTYLVRSADQEFVLKREPPGAKARSAHDMGREFRMLRAVGPHYGLAPDVVLLCEDSSVFGGAFLVMERVSGVVVRDAEADPAALPARFEGLIDALAALHVVDITADSLTSIPRSEGYRRRQTEGWAKRFRNAATSGDGRAERVIAWLCENIPSDPERLSVVHNDFKMDNLVWRADAPNQLAAVLDWEMATIGDPLMDLACTLSFWVEPTDPPALLALRSMPSARAGVSSRQAALDHYARRTGARVADFRFYRCFGLFRRAAIEQQKFHRFTTGEVQDERFRHLDRAVSTLLDECENIISARRG